MFEEKFLALGCRGSTPVNSTSAICKAFECGGQAGGPVQEEKARPGGPVQNISDVGVGGVRNGNIRVFTPSLRTRDYLSVNNSLLHKMHILFR